MSKRCKIDKHIRLINSPYEIKIFPGKHVAQVFFQVFCRFGIFGGIPTFLPSQFYITSRLADACLFTNMRNKPNVELQWEKDENTSKDAEPAKHLKENLSHKFSWRILFAAPENKRIRKILEASEIALKRPSLNEQIEFVFVFVKAFVIS